MKKLTFIILFFASSGIAAFSQGLTIIDQDYDKAKLQSSKENKLLLTFFTAPWCGPCKRLEKKVFDDPATAAEIDKSFIVLRYNFENDRQYRLALKHHINAVPKVVAFNNEHFVIDTTGGDPDMAKEYLDFLSRVLQRNREAQFSKGISNSTELSYPKFYEDLFFSKNKIVNTVELRKYWQSAHDPFSEVSFAVIALTGVQLPDDIQGFFFKNISKYEELFGAEDIAQVRGMIFLRRFNGAIDFRDRKAFTKHVELARIAYKETEFEHQMNYWEAKMRLAERRFNESVQTFAQWKATASKTEYRTDAFCRMISLYSSDALALKQCRDWMKPIMDKEPEPGYLSTFVRLQYKLGEKEEARRIMTKALEIARADKADITEFRNWLAKSK